MVYNPAELKQVLSMIGDGNKTVGGLQTVLTGFYGTHISIFACGPIAQR